MNNEMTPEIALQLLYKATENVQASRTLHAQISKALEVLAKAISSAPGSKLSLIAPDKQ